MKNAAAVVFGLCGRTAALLRTKTGNDQNGDPRVISGWSLPLFESNKNFTFAQDNDLEPKRRAGLNILDRISPEGNLVMDLRRRYITQRSAKNNGGKTAARNTKAAPAPTERYLKDPFTSVKIITRDGAFSRENIV